MVIGTAAIVAMLTWGASFTVTDTNPELGNEEPDKTIRAKYKEFKGMLKPTNQPSIMGEHSHQQRLGDALVNLESSLFTINHLTHQLDIGIIQDPDLQSKLEEIYGHMKANMKHIDFDKITSAY